MNVLDLFSGIGGFALGLESCGMRTVAFCERDPFAAGVLRHHWPHTRIYSDVRHVTAQRLADDGIPPPDLICGGFPCQPFSVAGKRKGTDDDRHLWPEFARIIGECRPRWVIAENVPGIRTIAADGVLADLGALGYACWPCVVGAENAGAPHRRQRAWFLAHAKGERRRETSGHEPGTDSAGSQAGCSGNGGAPSAPARDGQRILEPAAGAAGVGRDVADAGGNRELQRAEARHIEGHGACCGGSDVANAEHRRREGRQPIGQRPVAALPPGGWDTEPALGRVADGVPHRVDQLRALGNAVVPAVVAAIGRAILRVESECAA